MSVSRTVSEIFSAWNLG